MTKAEQLIKFANDNIETPFVTARFGDGWKDHQKRMLDEGQITVEMLIELAWKQGRRALLLEGVIHENVK